MKYLLEKKFNRFTKRGQVRKPSYVGPMVLLDFLSPKYADAYRKLISERGDLWEGCPVKRPPSDQVFSKIAWESYREQQEAWLAPRLAKLDIEFAQLCKQAAEEGLP